MNKTVTTVSAFLLGAAAGAAGVWYILKDRYAQIAQEEIDSVKAAFSRRYSDPEKDDSPTEDISDEEPEEEPTRATDMIKQEVDEINEKHDYTAYSTKPDISKVVEKMIVEEEKKEAPPYEIPAEEFGDMFDYEQIELTFFADKILADDNMELIEDVEDVVGFEALSKFEPGEVETVYIRNDRLKCEYEIVLDERTYTDALNHYKPYQKGIL